MGSLSTDGLHALVENAPTTASSAVGAQIEVVDLEEWFASESAVDILVVDDAPSNLVAYEAALAPLGRNVAAARSGLEALAKLLEQDFAVIVLDVSMPEMSGIETARVLRQRVRSKRTPIVFVTGKSWPDEVVVQAYELGAFDFVTKPIVPEVLRAKVNVYLQLQDRTRQLVTSALQLRDANKQLAQAEQRQREREANVATARRLEKLQLVTAALAKAKTPSEVAGVVVRLGAEAVDATASVLWSATVDGVLTVEGSYNVPTTHLDKWQTIPAGARHPASRVFMTREAIWCENEEDFVREAPDDVALAREAGRAWAFGCIPLVSDERSIGVLSFAYEGQHEFTPSERAFLQALARTCEQALERSRLYAAEAEARVAEVASRRKDELLAMLGHELRNPLSAITSALELLRLRATHPTHELAVIDRQVTHLTRLVHGLVDIARITRGKIALEREPVQLVAAAEHALDAVRALIVSRHHRVNIDVAADLFVDADRVRLEQVLVNLLENAAIYTPDNGRIDLIAEADDAYVLIAVRDNGDGIAPSLMPHLFESFVQGDRTLDRREGGLGLGLTLVGAIAEQHGGNVDAHSDGVGRGATFRVRWPRAASVTDMAAMPINSLHGELPSSILVVDDNADNADMLAELLRAKGPDVTTAYDGETALELADRIAPEVALLDIGLPGMNGYELARRIRLLPSCSNTMLIAITGYGEPEHRHRTREAGFAHHVVKPVSRDTILPLLRTAKRRVR